MHRASEPAETLPDALFRMKSIMMARSRNEPAENAEYVRLRQALTTAEPLRHKLPPFVQRCRSLDEFWTFIKGQDDPSGVIGRYDGRRRFLDDTFDPLLAELEAAHLASPAAVDVQLPIPGADPTSADSIAQHLAKCDTKLREGDYAGAITNARSLVEAVLLDLDQKLTGEIAKNDGNLIKLHKRVQAKLNLDPANPDLSDSLTQVLGGLSSVVTGLSGLRNHLSDAHATRYRPRRHHAVLVVNSAKTLVQFWVDTFEYQRARGLGK